MIANVTHQERRSQRWRLRVSLTRARVLVGGFCLLLMAVDDVHILQARAGVLAQARQQTAALAASLALQAESMMRTTEVMLADVVDRIERGDGADGTGGAPHASVGRVVADTKAVLDWINFVAFYDREGRQVFGPAGLLPRDVAAGSAWFVDHSTSADRNTRIGAPMSLAPGGRLILPVTRRVNRADGSFAGVAMVGLDIQRWLADYRSLPLPSKGMVGIYAPNGRLLLRQPSAPGDIGQDRFVPPAGFHDAAAAGSLDLTSPADQITRLVSYRRFLDGLLVVTVGEDRAAVLAGWARDAMWHTGGMVVVVGLVVWLGRIIERQEQRRRAAELRAARRNTKRQIIAQHATDILLEYGPDLICRHVEHPQRDICGYRSASLLGTRMLDRLLPVDAEAVAQAFAAAAAGAAPPELLVQLQHQDGRPVWFEIVLRRLDDSETGPVILGMMRDVTARRLVEESEAAAVANLRQAHATLLRAERVTQEGHWRLDLNSREIVLSGEAARIFGWADGAALPAILTLDTLMARIYEEDREPLTNVLHKASADGRAFKSDFRLVRANGEIREVACVGGPDIDERGERTGLIGSLQDTTERAALEQEMHHENKIKTIGRLASGVAHDFNNLLQSITSCLELISDKITPDSPARDFVRIALEASERGSYLTHHLLSYARKQMLKPKRVYPGELVRDMKVLLERTLGPNIRVVVDIAGPVPAIEVDPTHLQTALLNLGINSGHAMPQGGVLTLQVSMEMAPRPVVVIAVADTGIGMDAATLAQAVEPFFTTKGVKGTGLGLSMVNGFAHQSGGEMRISSRPGEGTRIELRLPAMPARGPEPIAELPPARPIGNRVLLVEDAADVRITTAAFLASASIQTMTADNCEEALAHLARGERFDVLVTDYAMPGLDGVQTIQRARALQPGLPAIIITGFADIDAAPSLPQEVQVLRKPFLRRDLLSAVQRAMAQEKSVVTSANDPREGHAV